MFQPSTRVLFFAAALLGGAVPMIAGEEPPVGLVRSAAPDWPQWQGPRRDGVCEEKGLLASWPAEGPHREWTFSGIGRGYASPIVVGETIYVGGDEGEDLLIRALSLDGKLRWERKNGRAWTGPSPGARASCCYDDGKLYHMNAHGRIACLDARAGDELWAVEVLERFAAMNITWGISESVLVDGDLVFVTPVGAKALMAALDKRSGATVWTAEPLDGDQASYGSPILLQVGERRLLVNTSARHAFAVDARNGEVCWRTRHLDPSNTITSTPVLTAGGVVFTNASRNFGAVYCLGPSVLAGDQLWSVELAVSHGGLVSTGERLYGASSRGAAKGWVAIDAATGAAAGLNDRPIGSLVHAGDRFYCLTERGTITLEKAGQDGFVTTGSFQLADEKDVWTHPVICKGRLYLRDHQTLSCYSIR